MRRNIKLLTLCIATILIFCIGGLIQGCDKGNDDLDLCADMEKAAMAMQIICTGENPPEYCADMDRVLLSLELACDITNADDL